MVADFAHSASASAHSATARRRRSALAAAVLALTTAGFAQREAGAGWTTRLAGLLHHENPVLRGEAGLALATTGDARWHGALLSLAKAPEPAARLRGILALGVLGAPGTEEFLGGLLGETSPKSAERFAAALALGLLPDELSSPTFFRRMRRLRGGSYQRHAPELTALLAGLTTGRHPSKAGALRDLLDDAANKDPTLRRLAIRLLAAMSGTLDRARIETLLTSRNRGDRLGILEAMARGLLPLDDSATTVERLARRDPDPAVRAAALDALTRHRRLAALEIGVDALRSKDPVEAAAGVRAALALGGGAIREAIEGRVERVTRPDLSRAMLAAFAATAVPSPEFADRCARMAADPERQEEVRIQAALVAARAGHARGLRLARELLSRTRRREDLRALARIAVRAAPSQTVIDALLSPDDAPGDPDLPRRLAALLAAGDRGVIAWIRKALDSPHLDAQAKSALLRGYRSSVLRLDHDVLAALPAPLGALLD